MPSGDSVGSCAHCRRTLTLHRRGLCKTCHLKPDVRAAYPPIQRVYPPRRPRAYRARYPCIECGRAILWSSSGDLCPACRPPSPAMGARLSEPLLTETVELYAARVEAGCDLWTGRPRR